MRLIPGKTKVRLELFKGVSLTDIIIGAAAMGLMILIFLSNIGGKIYFCIGIGFLAGLLLVRFDTEPSYIYIMRILRHLGYKRNYEKLTAAEQTAEDFEDFFSSDEKEIKQNEKDRKKQEKELYKQEKKILSSRTATKEEKDNVWKARAERSANRKKQKKQDKYESTKYEPMQNITAFTDIKDGYIEYGGEYYGAAIEIPSVAFRFFSAVRRNNSIENGVGRVLRSINQDYSANIVKIERPILFDEYIKREYEKLDEICGSYEIGLLSEQELKARCEMINQRIDELKKLCFEDKVIVPFYYIVLFDSQKKQLDLTVESALESLRGGELQPKRLDDKELAVFLKYTNEIDFDERDIENIPPQEYARWAMPTLVSVKAKTVEINNIITYTSKVSNYPGLVEDGWIAELMSIPSTKVMIKCKPLDRQKAIASIDRSIQEINDRLNNTGIESRIIELSAHAESLSALLMTLQGDNESLVSVNIYVTSYDINLTRNTPMPVQPPKSMRTSITTMKKTVRRMFSENKFRLESMDFDQMYGYLGSQVSGYDPLAKNGRGIPTNTVAAAYPWVYANIFDEKGVKLGVNDNVPVFVDFFQRNDERVNSNMVIVGKSGSGKSYATKSILTNLAADDTKIFILDPENEYSELAHNLKGKIINVGNATQGRLNPFHIITALEDEEGDNQGESTSYATHLQFLEEFFKQSLVNCERDALEYLNTLIDRTYMNKGINASTNLSKLKPEDYPIFDDLYDTILAEFQTTENEYIRSMLRVLMNYISKFSTGGRNAGIWNGPSTVTTEENFTVFNFQSLLANRNSIIANSQMLLVLKYIDNEIIKNRDYNTKYGTKRKIVVVIDEAHVFIDAKYPIALDFMFQLAKRIRKYNGMQIVITQNIKDFVGSEEIARKSTAIINACQYSFIFALSPNDMDDLCRLYEKSGGINETEQEQIVSAPRGQAFVILSSQHRSTFKIKVPKDMVRMFKEADYNEGRYFGEDGEKAWNEYIAQAKALRQTNDLEKEQSKQDTEEDVTFAVAKSGEVFFEEISEEEFEKQRAEKVKQQVHEEAELEAMQEARQQYKEGLKAKVRQDGEGLYDSLLGEAQDDEFANLPVINFEEVYADDEQDIYNPDIETEDNYSDDTEHNYSEADDDEDYDAEAILDSLLAESGGDESQEDDDNALDESDENDTDEENDAEEKSDAVVANSAIGQSNPVITEKGYSKQARQNYVHPNADEINMQQGNLSAGMEQVLEKLTVAIENMSRLNYDNILAEVQRMMAAGGVPVTVNAPVAAGVAADGSEDEDDFDDILSSLFSDDEAEDEDEEIGVDVEQEDDDDDDESFDILSFLAEQAEDTPDVTPLDGFAFSEDDIIVISLNDLASYNLKMRKE